MHYRGASLKLPSANSRGVTAPSLLIHEALLHLVVVIDEDITDDGKQYRCLTCVNLP
jgi:hypothetical protein